MKNENAVAIIPSLQAQMQWFSGKPQTGTTPSSRVLYDFNNQQNMLEVEQGRFSSVTGEDSRDHQESSICFSDTGNLALFFTGRDIYDAHQNKVNPHPLNAMKASYLTSVIAPTSDIPGLAYNVYYVNNDSGHIEYATVVYKEGPDAPATFTGLGTLEGTYMRSPLGLACVHDNEYWILALENANTMVAYPTNKTKTKRHISLTPFLALKEKVDCSQSSIVAFGDQLAVTVNGNLMYGEIDFLRPSGFQLEKQKAVSVNNKDIVSLTAAFSKNGAKLFYLKAATNSHNHVFIYDIEEESSYSADTSYSYVSQYRSLKLAPNGIVYGINDFKKHPQDPLLILTENDKGDTNVTEQVFSDAYSSVTFGNVQYELNQFK